MVAFGILPFSISAVHFVGFVTNFSSRFSHKVEKSQDAFDGAIKEGSRDVRSFEGQAFVIMFQLNPKWL